MRFFLPLLSLLTGLAGPAALAQPVMPFAAPAAAPQTGQAQCSALINETDFTVHGSVRTALAATAEGGQARHESNFAIKPGDRWQVCSSGPFFEGGRVELIIRTLFPVFDCKTRLGQPIRITATRKADNSGYDWQASCF